MARFAVVTVAVARVLPVTVVGTVQSIQHKGICSYPAHLFIDVLAKVGYVKNATSIIQVRINQIFPKAFENDNAICLWFTSITPHPAIIF
jgi:hypothetical protein